MKNEDIVPKTMVRLGQPRNNKPRLLKVVLDSVNSKNKLLGSTKWLRAKTGDGNIPHGWSNVFLTPDLTKEDRDKNKELRGELESRKHNESNPNPVTYRGQIVDRKDIRGRGPQNGSGNGMVSQAPPQYIKSCTAENSVNSVKCVQVPKVDCFQVSVDAKNCSLKSENDVNSNRQNINTCKACVSDGSSQACQKACASNSGDKVSSQTICQLTANKRSSHYCYSTQNVCQATSNKSSSHICFSSIIVSCENQNSNSGETV